jgi:altronate dehydratase
MKPALVISDADNVATALENLEPGATLELGGVPVTVRQPIPRGHKIARVAIAAGQPVVKYGSPIGRATSDIAAGEHVHAHNVASERGRGDLSATKGQAPQGSSRLAEPADENLAQSQGPEQGGAGERTSA